MKALRHKNARVFQVKNGEGDSTDSEKRDNQSIRKILTSSKTTTNTSNTIFSREEGEMFAMNSLFCFSSTNKFRIFIQKMVSAKLFVTIINLIILVNCIFLIFETIDSLKIINSYSNYVFTSVFTIECILKIIAYGFILDDHSYLRDPWNWLDFIVVITGLMSFLPSISANLFALRVFRLIRPLKTISMLPNMRIFISTLISSMVDVGIVFLLFLFFLLIFAILGLSLWNETFEKRCRTSTTTINGQLPIDPLYKGHLCGGRIDCGGKSEYCLSLLDIRRKNKVFIPEAYEYKNELELKAFNFGLTKFDNILYSLLSVFQASTTEGWSSIMSMLMDGHNYYVSLIYFVLCVVVNYYFMLNLIVAVLLYNFSKARQQDLHISLENVNLSTKLHKKKYIDKHSKTININMNVKMDNYNEQAMKRKYQRKYTTIDLESRTKDVKGKSLFTKQFFNKFKRIQLFEKIKPHSDYHKNNVIVFYCYVIYKQPIVQYFFYFCILINSIILGLERVNMSNLENKIIEKVNIVLVAIFTLEMFLLIVGYGFNKFIRDAMSVWDCLIVIVSIIEIGLKENGKLSTNSSASIASTFRMLRILRVFKLFRSWTSFQIIMESIGETMYRMVDYIFVFILFLFMYTLLGFSFFNDSLKFDDDTFSAKSNSNFYNFDNFPNSLVSVFMIIIGDHWYDLFYECYRSDKNNFIVVIIYFITLVLFGQITLMNIFLAYLIDNFQSARAHLEKNVNVRNYILYNIYTSSDLNESKVTNYKLKKRTASGRIEAYNYYLMKLQGKQLLFEGEFDIIAKNKLDLLLGKKVKEEFYVINNKNGKQKANNVEKVIILNDLLNYENHEGKKKEVDIEDDDNYYLFDIDYEEENEIKMNRIEKKLTQIKTQQTIRNAEIKKYHLEHEFQKHTILKSETNRLPKVEFDDDMPVVLEEDEENLNNNTVPIREVQTETIRKTMSNVIKPKGYVNNETLENLVVKKKDSTNNISEIAIQDRNSSVMSSRRESSKDVNSITESKKAIKDKKDKCNHFIKTSSLFLFSEDNPIRHFMTKVVNHSLFNLILFLFILANCIVLCIDNQFVNPDSKRAKAIKYLNYIFNILFIIEAIMKIISLGFIFTKNAYLRNIINIIDFFCIIIGLIDIFSSSDSLRYLRTLRAIRSVKPIRLIIKSDNLSLMTSTLVNSIPAMGNLLLACISFIFIFALLGISFFKTDLYYYCNISPNYKSEEACVKAGGKWTYYYENYSNFLNAMKTNFEIMMTEGWADTMRFASMYKNTKWVEVYFILYVIIGYMFILNLIVAVVIQKFNTEKKKGRTFAKLNEPERNWIHLQQLMMKFHPIPKININKTSKCRVVLSKIVMSKAFEYVIDALIALSSVTLIMQYSGSSDKYEDALDYTNYVFTFLFNVELVLKLIVYCKAYFYNSWNRFDFIIILISDIMVILNILTYCNVMDVHSISTLPMILRLFRIFRIFRLLSYMVKLRALIDTLIYLLPSVGNIAIIIAILLLIYGNIGMNIFGTVPFRDKINRNNNFKDFISSALLLFEASTGEGWTNMMNELAYHDCRDPLSEAYQKDVYCYKYNVICYDESDLNYTSLTTMNRYSCGNNFSYMFFITYIIIGPIFLMNLCVVMVIEGFSESMYENEGVLPQDYMDKFVSVWMEYDPECRMVIRPHEFILILKELQPPIGFNYDRHTLTDPLRLKKDYQQYLVFKALLNEKKIASTSNEEENKAKTQIKILPHSYEFNNFYLSKNQKFHTNDVEVMKLVDKFHLLATEDKKQQKKSPGIQYSYTFSTQGPKEEEYYIHFVDACLAMSRFAISKAENISFNKLRKDMVGTYTKKMWVKQYNKETIEPFFKDSEEVEKEKPLSKVLASKILLKVQKIFKARLLRTREKIKKRHLEENLADLEINNRLKERNKRFTENYDLNNSKCFSENANMDTGKIVNNITNMISQSKNNNNLGTSGIFYNTNELVDYTIKRRNSISYLI